jgi:hypothetical protein
MTDVQKRAKPLIGLDDVNARPDRPVLLVNGQDARDYLTRVVKGLVVVTWIGGVGSTDWEPLKQRRVDIWPDGGAAGRRYAANIAQILFKLGCRIRILNDDTPAALTGAMIAKAEQWDIQRIKAYTADRWGAELTAPPPKPPGPTHVVSSQPPPADQGLPPVQGQGPVYTGPEPLASVWQRYGVKERNGVPHSNASNCFRALKGLNDDLGLGIAYDEFLKAVVWSRGGRYQRLDDNDLVVLQCKLQAEIELTKATYSDVQRAVTRLAREKTVNCAKDWLQSLQWDGTERLPYLMGDAFGAAQDDYTAAVGRCFMMSMAKRILEPGCQQDYVMVLEGKQGGGKSSALAVIGGEWYAEVHEEFGSLEFLIAIQGKVLVAIGELAGFKGARLERVKGIITRRVDTFRSKYGIWANDHKRVACFVGDTNESTYLNDPTGGRRYWPVAVGPIDVDWLTEHRDQLWAEAVARLARGESYFDVPVGLASEQQENRREIIPWEEQLIPWLEEKQAEEMTMSKCLRELNIAPRDELAAAKIIAPILRRLGWKRMRKWIGRNRTYVYRTDAYISLNHNDAESL